ncbi:hypothetical protein Tco_0332229 [Tanacetum coccineum]
MHPCAGSTDKSKNHKKTVKSEQTRTRESEEYNAKQEAKPCEALANFFLLQGPFLHFSKVIYNLRERKERQGPNVQSSQTPTVLTVEKGAGTPFTIHPSSSFHPHAEILKKFNYTDVKSASTLVDLKKPLVKDGDADDVDVYLYRSMIESLMYLITSRPDIMFAICACARFQVTPKTS